MLGYKITLKCISIKQQARLAQSVARETLNLKVEGSSPSLGFLFIQESWQSDRWLWRCQIFCFAEVWVVKADARTSRALAHVTVMATTWRPHARQ